MGAMSHSAMGTSASASRVSQLNGFKARIKGIMTHELNSVRIEFYIDHNRETLDLFYNIYMFAW